MVTMSMSMTSMSMSMTLSIFICSTHFSWNFVGNWMTLFLWNTLALLSWNLTLMMLRNLVALLLNMFLADRSNASIAWVSISLAIVTCITMSLDDLSVMTNNSRAMVDLGVGLGALSGESVLTLLNVGGVNNSLAHWSGDLSGVLLGDLVALLLNMLLALGSRRISMVSWISFSLSLSMSRVSMADNMRVMTNNSRAMVDLLVNLLAVLGDNVLALLNVGGVNNHIIFLMAFLSLVLDWLLVTLLVRLAEALEVVVRLVTISWLGLSFSLGITTMMTSMNDLRVMTNNSRAVVHLLVSLTAVLGDNVSTLLNVGCVHNHIILLMADLFMISVTFLGVSNIIDDMTLCLITSVMSWFRNWAS